MMNRCSLDKEFLKENMMGPNSMRIIEELCESFPIKKGMRVLDLGCGKGLTSIFLAKEFGATVFAADLWISAAENYERFKSMGLEEKIIPIHTEAHSLPFADEFFDIAVCVDAYHYFGTEKEYLDKHFAPLVKKGGKLAIAVPGIKEEFENEIPSELVPYWQEDMNFHCCNWWEKLWLQSDLVRVDECKELKCLKQAWSDWLECDNEFARRDIEMMKAEGGKYFNLVAMIATRI